MIVPEEKESVPHFPGGRPILDFSREGKKLNQCYDDEVNININDPEDEQNSNFLSMVSRFKVALRFLI